MIPNSISKKSECVIDSISFIELISFFHLIGITELEVPLNNFMLLFTIPFVTPSVAEPSS